MEKSHAASLLWGFSQAKKSIRTTKTEKMGYTKTLKGTFSTAYTGRHFLLLFVSSAAPGVQIVSNRNTGKPLIPCVCMYVQTQLPIIYKRMLPVKVSTSDGSCLRVLTIKETHSNQERDKKVKTNRAYSLQRIGWSDRPIHVICRVSGGNRACRYISVCAPLW